MLGSNQAPVRRLKRNYAPLLSSAVLVCAVMALPSPRTLECTVRAVRYCCIRSMSSRDSCCISQVAAEKNPLSYLMDLFKTGNPAFLSSFSP